MAFKDLSNEGVVWCYNFRTNEVGELVWAEWHEGVKLRYIKVGDNPENVTCWEAEDSILLPVSPVKPDIKTIAI